MGRKKRLKTPTLKSRQVVSEKEAEKFPNVCPYQDRYCAFAFVAERNFTPIYLRNGGLLYTCHALPDGYFCKGRIEGRKKVYG